ncbi:MAG: hypothetical protein V7K77_16560 [Nostoc sp.]|uniref:nSTAND1 domain-containing NTPase n=1 Tax=Nostoc sp. TaxID=1180 RepID=UPI002FF6FBCA
MKNNTQSSCFLSFYLLKEAHTELLKRAYTNNNTPDFLTDVENFIRRSQLTGVLLNSDQDRSASQNLLDYWATKLSRIGHEPPNFTLAEFDSKLAPTLDDSLCPYPGLVYFKEQNHEFFFGRQNLVQDLLKQLSQNRLLAIVGSASCGKSSVVMGGLLPNLKYGRLPDSQNWHYYPRIVPGSNPLESLSRLIQSISTKNAVEQLQHLNDNFQKNPSYLVQKLREVDDLPTVIVIDQFEEIFTLCQDNTLRETFIAQILGLVQIPDGKDSVIIVMQSDYESYLEKIPLLKTLFNTSKVRVTSFDSSELRAVIEKPAERVGLKFEDGIINSLIRDIISEPTPLPLLQFTLKSLWNKREYNYITWKSYQQIGGSHQALVLSADIFYQSLTFEEKVIAKLIFLSFISLNKGLNVTSKRIRLIEYPIFNEEESLILAAVSGWIGHLSNINKNTDLHSIINQEKVAELNNNDQKLDGKIQIYQLRENLVVQERFQRIIKRKLQIQITDNPPLFPWETPLINYPDINLVWIAQESKLNLPIPLPKRIFQQILENCQTLLTSSLPLGVKIIHAVETFFPNESQSLNDLAGLVLRSPNRSIEPLEKIHNLSTSDYANLQLRQKMALLLLAAKQLLENLTLQISPNSQVLQRQWLTSIGPLNIRVEKVTVDTITKLIVQGELPIKGILTLRGSDSLATAQSSSSGYLMVELICQQLNQTYTLEVDFPEIDQQSLFFVIDII